MLGFYFLSNRPCHSKRMYPNFVQYAVIGHKDGVLLVFFSFYYNFFHCHFLLVFTLNVFFFFFCSYGTAENKYSKVPQIKDDIVVEFKMQLTLRLRFYVCASVAVTSELSNNKSC